MNESIFSGKDPYSVPVTGRDKETWGCGHSERVSAAVRELWGAQATKN